MASLLEYYNGDFTGPSPTIALNSDYVVKIGKDSLTITISLKIDGDYYSKLLTFYIPAHKHTYQVIEHLLFDFGLIKDQIGGQAEAFGSFRGEAIVGKGVNVYSKITYIYSETQLTPSEVTKIGRIASNMGIAVSLRSTDYIIKRMEIQSPLAFISHDSKDKELIAQPLAFGLSSRLCPVWYDEYSLKVGDSLRESIEKGIKEARKCILILTKNFLDNPGWTKKEFNSIFTREMIFNERIVLPIWYNVTKQEVYEYSPSLADTVALKWPSIENMTEAEYKQEVEQLISKLHTSITAKPLT